jgi:DNA polymerase-1
MYAFVRALNVPVISVEGEEADDVIASYTHVAVAANHFVRIICRDKDLLQLVKGDQVQLYDWVHDATVGEKKAHATFGLPPHLIPDAQCLIGDRVDNIPGRVSLRFTSTATPVVVSGTTTTVAY